MKTFHPLSFGIGLGSGLLVLAPFFLTMSSFDGPARNGLPPNGGNMQQMRGANGGVPNTAMMAERFHMTEAELQAELDSGKTMQEIAEENGVEFPAGGRGMMQRGSTATEVSASGATITGTGNVVVPTSTFSSVSQ